MRDVASLMLALACSASFAEGSAAPPSPIASAPTFRDAVVPAGQHLCPATWSSTRSPTGLYLSVLRQAKAAGEKELLTAGPGYSPSDRVRCTVVIRFDHPATAPAKLSLDYRGIEIKDPDATATFTIQFDRQTHTFVYGRGRWIDSSQSDTYRRFIVDVPTGAKDLRVRLSGNAASSSKTDTVLIGIDAMDMCFLDAEHPDWCGTPGKPNQSAGS